MAASSAAAFGLSAAARRSKSAAKVSMPVLSTMPPSRRSTAARPFTPGRLTTSKPQGKFAERRAACAPLTQSEPAASSMLPIALPSSSGGSRGKPITKRRPDSTSVALNSTAGPMPGTMPGALFSSPRPKSDVHRRVMLSPRLIPGSTTARKTAAMKFSPMSETNWLDSSQGASGSGVPGSWLTCVFTVAKSADAGDLPKRS